MGKDTGPREFDVPASTLKYRFSGRAETFYVSGHSVATNKRCGKWMHEDCLDTDKSCRFVEIVKCVSILMILYGC